jgi:hypothetical protein
MGSLGLSGDLPPGAQVTARDAAGRIWPIAAAGTALAPGTYTIEFRAAGYETERRELAVGPGEARSWRPALVPLAAPTTPAYRPDPPAQPTRDVEQDRAAVAALIRDFVGAFNRRDADAVVPLLPANARSDWAALLVNRDVTDFSASAAHVGAARVDGDTATIDFTINIFFRAWNQTHRPVLQYRGTATYGSDGWRLNSLAGAGG